jgi:hypothetical protein
MKLPRYAVKPMGDSGSGALASKSSSISPWAGFGAVATTRAQVRHINGAGRPKGLTEGSTV